MDLQLRAAAQSSAIQWANSLMQQGVSAAMIEDAINALLVKLKEQIMIDTLLQQQKQETPSASEEGGEDGGWNESAGESNN